MGLKQQAAAKHHASRCVSWLGVPAAAAATTARPAACEPHSCLTACCAGLRPRALGHSCHPLTACCAGLSFPALKPTAARCHHWPSQSQSPGLEGGGREIQGVMYMGRHRTPQKHSNRTTCWVRQAAAALACMHTSQWRTMVGANAQTQHQLAPPGRTSNSSIWIASRSKGSCIMVNPAVKHPQRQQNTQRSAREAMEAGAGRAVRSKALSLGDQTATMGAAGEVWVALRTRQQGGSGSSAPTHPSTSGAGKRGEPRTSCRIGPKWCRPVGREMRGMEGQRNSQPRYARQLCVWCV